MGGGEGGRNKGVIWWRYLEWGAMLQYSGSPRSRYFWAFRISYKIFTDPCPAYSSECHVNKLKILSLTTTYRYIFFPLSSVAFICFYDNVLSITWCDKIRIPRVRIRIRGSGSVKRNLTDP
jgi:hypothetical protein